MAGEDDDKSDKTEDATPRRRSEARESGQVALSAELLAASMLWAGLGAFVVAGGVVAQSCGGMVTHALAGLGVNGRLELDARTSAALFTSSLREVALGTLAIVVPMWGVALLAGYLQVGFQVSTKAISFDPGRLSPAKGFGRIFSLRSSVKTLMALVKIVAIGSAMALTAWSQLPEIARFADNEIGPTLAGIGRVAMRSASAALVAIAAIAVVDYLFQRWQHERDLRMSKREIRDEVRSSEGDPHIKSRIRGIQREMARRRMMNDVPTATVVVTNPTHYAVALRYDREADPAKRRAPYVVAKGVDLVAQRIKEVAREADVPLHENVALARALHAQCEIGDEVPEALYQAVAAVLAYVYRVQGEVVRA